MKQLSKKLLCLTALISAGQIFAANTISTLVPRSQSFNAARQNMGWDNPVWGINRMPQDERYSAFNLTFAYNRTFRDERLARCFFGDDLVCGECGDLDTIKISGSAVENRCNTDWLADNFGLARDHQSTVSFSPQISNFLIDFSYYLGLDDVKDGLYFRIHTPFVHTKWSMNARETCDEAGSIGYFAGYFSNKNVAADDLNSRFLDYANGCVPTIANDSVLSLLTNSNARYPFDDINWQPLCCSKINNDCECDSLTRNGFAEVRFVLGWNFVNDEEGDYHLGAGLYVAAPTGTRVGGNNCEGKQRYLFEPIVGNGKHWELGAQVTAHRIWWRNEEEDKSFGAYLVANVTHLFKTTQTRCFDLCSAGSNSRYMIAQRLQKNVCPSVRFVEGLDQEQNPTRLQFASDYAPVANLTTRQVTSSIGAQGDVALSFAYQCKGFQWDLGYNFWGRSCEKLCLKNDCCPPDLGDWALKGDQMVYGFIEHDTASVRLAATDSGANIHTGSNLCNGIDYSGEIPPTTTSGPLNFYADKNIPARASGSGDFINRLGSSTQVYTSANPVLIKESDFDLGGTRGISHKVFTHLNWAWTDREDCDYTPWIGIGAEVEFGKTEDACCKPKCCATPCGSTADCSTPCETSCKTSCCPEIKKCCVDCAISQWGIWLKMGVSR